MENAEVAKIFYEVADLLELQGVAFKPIAYRKAASSIEQLEEPIQKVSESGRLKEIPGVGESIVKKVEEILATGKLDYLNRLRKEVPQGLMELVSVPEVGPKTAMTLYKELGVTDIDHLKEALQNHKLRDLKGFGEKTEQRILQGIRILESRGGRMLLGEAYPVAKAYVDYLNSSGVIKLVSLAGSLRRGKETIGDIDILVGHDDADAATKIFTSYPEVDEVVMSGPTKTSVRLKSGLQVDVRVIAIESWGAALQYFTGSKEHNVAIRSIGVRMGFKLSEYGVFERDSGKLIAGASEEDVYKVFGMAAMPPEIRENGGELEAAKEGTLPDLVQLDDIRGDLHVHTNWSDGSSTIKEVAAAAIKRGYDYVCISDHSQSLKIANGMPPEKVRKQIDAIRKAEDEVGGKIRLFTGSEVDIKADGTLDYPSSVLKDLDVVIGSVHSRFRMSKDEMSERITRAMESGMMDILGHPTGRVIGQREPYELDFGKVLATAKETGVFMELNSFPDRLDLRDVHCRLAKDAGVRIAVNTDSHNVSHLENMMFGVITARRGWLEDKDVLNTMGAKAVAARLHGVRG
jgi:DNA polymerase (family 10)